MAGQTRTAALIMFAGAVLAGAGIAESAGEIAPYVTGGGDTAQRFAAIADGHDRPGDSIGSKDRFMTACLDLPQTILVRVQPVQRRDAFAQHCRSVARTAVAEMPTYAAGWLAVAVASAALDDLPQVQSALAASARTGPDLAWLADRRSALIVAHLTDLGEAERAIYRADLATLLRGRAGTGVVADRYVRNPAQRETITEVVEATPTLTQQRFLGRVRDRSSSRGRP